MAGEDNFGTMVVPFRPCPPPHLHRISHLQQILVGMCSGRSPGYWGSQLPEHSDVAGWHIHPGLQQTESGSPSMDWGCGEADSPVPAPHGSHRPPASPPPLILPCLPPTSPPFRDVLPLGTHRGIWSHPQSILGGIYRWNSQGYWDRRHACHNCVF